MRRPASTVIGYENARLARESRPDARVVVVLWSAGALLPFPSLLVFFRAGKEPFKSFDWPTAAVFFGLGPVLRAMWAGWAALLVYFVMRRRNPIWLVALLWPVPWLLLLLGVVISYAADLGVI